VPRADMFVCSENDLMRMLFSGNGADEWLQSWRASPELEDIYDRNRAAAARYSWSPRLFNPKLERWLHRIDVPTHIVWGADDRVIPPAYAAALKELIAGSTVATLPSCAHLPHVEQPQAFASEVSQFIRRAAR
jgi:pimeloyl-ACP methyl ester carboxylesterase